MSDVSNALGINPVLARMPAADIAMLHAKTGQQKLEKIKEAADDFEAMFVSEMLSNMTSTVETDPLFGGGEAEETWKSMMNQEYGKEIVKAGGIGMSKDIMAKMIEMQGLDMNAETASAPLPAALQKYITDEPQEGSVQ